MKKKKVNVYADSRAIYSLNPPIMRTAMGIELSIGDIQRCIWAKGQVEEVLADGTTINLDLINFDKDNSYLMKKVVKKSDQEEKSELIKEPVEEIAVNSLKEVVEEIVVEDPVVDTVEEIDVEDPVVDTVEEIKTESIQEKILKELKKEEPVVKKEFVNKQAFKVEK